MVKRIAGAASAAPAGIVALLRARAFLVAVGDAPDRTVVVVRDQHRAVLQEQHVVGTADVVVVWPEEAREEHFRALHGTIRVEEHGEDVAAELLRAIPRAVPRAEDRVL